MHIISYAIKGLNAQELFIYGSLCILRQLFLTILLYFYFSLFLLSFMEIGAHRVHQRWPNPPKIELKKLQGR